MYSPGVAVAGEPLPELIDRDHAELLRQRIERQAPCIERIERSELSTVEEDERFAFTIFVVPRGNTHHVYELQFRAVHRFLERF